MRISVMKKLSVVGVMFCGSTFSTMAKADDWGCQVLLCMSHAGIDPMSLPACVPPIEKLMQELASWHPNYPHCTLTSGQPAPTLENAAQNGANTQAAADAQSAAQAQATAAAVAAAPDATTAAAIQAAADAQSAAQAAQTQAAIQQTYLAQIAAQT